MVAPFQPLVNSALADQHAGSKQNSFESEDRREQGKWIFIEGMVLKNKIEGDPAEDESALKADKLDGANKPADPLENAMMDGERLRLAFQDAEWRQYSRRQLFQIDHLPRDASSRDRSAARRADFRVLSTVSSPTFRRPPAPRIYRANLPVLRRSDAHSDQ